MMVIVTRQNSDELYHFGTKGMRWGVRKYQNSDGSLTPAGLKRYSDSDVSKAKANYKSAKKEYNKSFNKAYNRAISGYSPIKKHRQANDERWKKVAQDAEKLRSAKSEYKSAKKAYKQTDEYKAERAERHKKALKVGAAVAGTALAAYGTYKVAKYVKDKRSSAAMKKAQQYLDENFLRKIGESTNNDPRKSIHYFGNKERTNWFSAEGKTGKKIIGEHNAKVVAKSRQMYKDATNTRLDRGLSKIVGAGDAVGDTVKRGTRAAGDTIKRGTRAAGDTVKRATQPAVTKVKRAGTTAKNRVLDVVNPQYEWTPGKTNTKTTAINGGHITTTTIDYVKRKVKRQ